MKFHVYFFNEKKNGANLHEFGPIAMLTRLPAYSVYSAMHFEEYSAPKPTAAEKPTVSGSKKKNSVAEDEDWVFL